MTRLVLACLISTLAAGSGAAATYSEAVLSSNPLGYFRMDETSGFAALDSALPAQNGTYTNGPLLNQAGPQSPAFPGFSATNAAAQFDGVDDHVANSSLPFSNSTTYTAEGWVNNTRANNAQAITGYVLSRGGAGAFDALGIVGTFSGTQGSLFLFNGSATLVQGSTAMTTNDWHHVAYTRSGTDVAVYLDGAFQAASSSYANNVASSNFFIGQRADGFASTQGLLDEVSVYDNTVLTGKQINAHYNAAFSTGLYSINNASFELQDVDLPAATNLNQTGSGDGGYSNDVVQGWTGGGTRAFGVFDTTNSEYAGTTGDSNPVAGGDGDQVGYITVIPNTTTGPISVSQTLPDPLQAGEYEFTLAIGSRLNRDSAGYLLELLAGETVVASEMDAIDLNSFAGMLTDRVISFSLDKDDPLIGELLTLRISNTQTSTQLLSTDFDNARLTFTAVPEPASLWLLLLTGLMAIPASRLIAKRTANVR